MLNPNARQQEELSPEFDELTDTIATAAAAPIRPWWLGEEETTGDEMSPEVPKVSPHVDVDDVTDWAAFHQLSNDDRSQMIAIQQEALLDAALELKWDLSADIADRSAALIYEGLFDHHRPRRVIWPPTRRQP